MSFSILPPELVHDIFEHVDMDVLLSLCLVCRLFHSEATPLLFKGIVLHAADRDLRSWWATLGGLAAGQLAAGTLNTEDIAKQVSNHDEQQTRFFEAIASRPEMSKYIRGLHLYLYLSDPADPEDEVVARTVAFLPSTISLQQLTIANSWRWDDPDEQQMQFILSHVPSSVTTLDLTECCLTPETIIKLLDNLPLLSSLVLASDFTQGEWTIRLSTKTPKLVHLENLYLLDPFRGRFFLQKILHYSTSLRSIWAAPISLQALSPRFLANLSELGVVGDFRVPTCPISTLIDHLVSTLKSCHKLHTFKLVSKDEETYLELWHALNRIDFLQYLPRSIRQVSLHYTHLSLDMIARFLQSASSSFERIELDRFIRLEKDTLDESTEIRDSDGIDKVDQVGKERGIEVGWYSRGVRWEVIEASNIAACEAVERLAAQWEKEGIFLLSKHITKDEGDVSTRVAEDNAGSESSEPEAFDE